MENMTLTNFLSVEEVARLSRVTPRTIRRYLSLNKGPVVTRVGGRVFVQRSHFDEWISKNISSRKAKL
ncbi:helix-turn-helix domain-containing protein [Gluconobacter sp. LMG 31484]|uniref:Helix-turn-helix domain-containing protein n=2 Tax=Gluconobacter vitians TaxID=2728102 RepID=A0ABR9Y4P4_9PROT|nr:helix-turn-helix domain-containing protein [Gluconobacter vitians]